MAKNKRKAAKLDDKSNFPPTKRRKPDKKKEETEEPKKDKKTIILPETELLPAEFKKLVREVVVAGEHETLVKLLAMPVVTPRRATRSFSQNLTTSECTALYQTLIWRTTTITEHMLSRHPDRIVDSLRALFNDPRTSETPSLVDADTFFSRLCGDNQHDMGDVVALMLDRWSHISFGHDQLDKLIKASIKTVHVDKPGLIECLMRQPGYNVNQPDSAGKRLIHYAIGKQYWNYNSRLLPAVLAHPHFVPELRRVNSGRMDNRTTLAVADDFYTDGNENFGTSPLEDKKRAVRDVHLLLQDGRVDLHNVTNPLVDEGYEGLAN